MRVKVSLAAVNNAKRYIVNVQNALNSNYNNFASEVNGALSQWNDPNVKKFIEINGKMTKELQLVFNQLSRIYQLCEEMERFILMYNEW
jgi:endonuclease IV